MTLKRLRFGGAFFNRVCVAAPLSRTARIRLSGEAGCCLVCDGFVQASPVSRRVDRLTTFAALFCCDPRRACQNDTYETVSAERVKELKHLAYRRNAKVAACEREARKGTEKTKWRARCKIRDEGNAF